MKAGMAWAVALTWELPQTILAGIIFVWFRLTGRVASVSVVSTKPVYNLLVKVDAGYWGVSLGRFTFLSVEICRLDVVHHEYGHSIQSLMLGPAYLLVVGLPSITMNILTRMSVLRADRYYYRWPESWADRLGGVRQ